MNTPRDFIRSLFLAVVTTVIVLVTILFTVAVINFLIAPLLVKASTQLANVEWMPLFQFLLFVAATSALFLLLKISIFRTKKG
jgi:uncharacterized BrkB/YihY/UPF0761 family membrane protein